MLRPNLGLQVLRVVVVGAENLDRPTLLRTADPYVVCSLNGSAKQQTYSEQATSNPSWHQPFEWITYDWATSEITFEVKVRRRLVFSCVLDSRWRRAGGPGTHREGGRGRFASRRQHRVLPVPMPDVQYWCSIPMPFFYLLWPSC